MESERNQPSEGSQHYSPEEMMSRLKKNERGKRQSRPEDDRELITREDGTQVVKVRRRKRRSKQPHKRKRKINTRIRWILLGTFTAITTLLIAGSFYIIAKYNGAAFKKETEANITALSGADQVLVTRLRVTPASVRAQKIEIAWDQYSYLASAVFHDIEGEIRATSFLSNSWDGEAIVSSKANVFLQTPQPSAETSQDTASSPYEFESYRCDEVNLHFGSTTQSPRITGMRASFRELPGGQSQIVCNHGTILMEGWPELELSSGIATVGLSGVELNALLMTKDARGGELQVKGHIQGNSNQPISLDIKAKQYPVQELLGKRLGELIQGQISSESGSLQYRHNQPANQALSLVIPFNSSEIQMTEFPMFADLKELTGDSKFTRPVFNDCKGTLKRTSDGVIIDDINFNRTNLISLKGKIAVRSDGKLSGSLTVQLPQRLIDHTKTPATIDPPRDGFYTLQVGISGSIHSPHDNLRELIKFDQQRRGPTPEPTRTSPAQPSPAIPLSPPAKPQSLEEKEKEFEELLR